MDVCVHDTFLLQRGGEQKRQSEINRKKEQREASESEKKKQEL